MALDVFDRLGIWVQRRFRRFRKSSLAVHSSIVISDLSRTLAFYKRLGFRRVSATRSDETTLLRNRSGAELNLIRQQDAEMPAAHARSSATVPVANLDKTMTHLRRRGIEIASGPFTGPTSRWFIVHDPDANQIEFFQTVARGDAQSALFHLVTGQELAAGITDAYYLPPEAEKRFVYCRTGSAILLVAATNLRKHVEEDLILVQLDPSAVSLAPTLDSDFDIDKSVAVNDISTYPDVYSPIDIDAISGAAKLPFRRRVLSVAGALWLAGVGAGLSACVIPMDAITHHVMRRHNFVHVPSQESDADSSWEIFSVQFKAAN